MISSFIAGEDPSMTRLRVVDDDLANFLHSLDAQ
jgi:hypothetical protein